MGKVFSVEADRRARLSNGAFLRAVRGSASGMDPPPSAARPASPESAPAPPVHDVIPARAVLTELARGFLLVRDIDPKRAARFAATFLRERVEADLPELVSPSGSVPASYASLGGSNRGAIDRGRFGRGP